MHDATAARTPPPVDDAPRGLDSAEAARRLARDGPNELPRERDDGLPATIVQVMREPMLLLLVAAAAIYFVLGDRLEATVLCLSVVFVIGLTVYQERRSLRALEALRELGSPRARVVRDGVPMQVAARDVVVGDRLLVAEGERLAADAGLLEAVGLAVDESLLTGESAPVAKRPPDGGGGGGEDDRVHAGTLVVQGHGVARVVATGTATAVGRIGARLAELRPGRSAMQREISRLVRLFMVLAAASCLALSGLLWWSGHPALQALLAGVTLAMANIPEEFPVVLTVFLALGAWRLARQRALVRRPAAIEALGAITTLCVDKTGTLTENRMAVARVDVEGRQAVPGRGCPAALAALLDVAALACPPGSADPMDAALRALQADAGRAARPLLREYPLRPDQPAVALAWGEPDGAWLACKGAPEAVLALCAAAPDARRAVLDRVAGLAADGLRVLGVADARLPADRLPDGLAGAGLHWRGLVAFADPLRATVPDAVAQARAAGIRVVMLTGDHAATAATIARQAGLDVDDGVVSGDRLETAGELDPGVLRHAVFARVRPEHKLRLVQALRGAGEVVAMTGDGVNDAPALLAADVGIAMGGRGTDVAREAAAIVLLDDDFSTIVRAIALGRAIHANIRRALRYVLAVHVPITALALLPLLAGGDIVLAPLHVVFLELVIDPACTLVFERDPPDPAAMRRPPRDPAARLLAVRDLVAALLEGAVMFLPVAAVLLVARQAGLPEPAARALAFSALVTGNLGLIARYRGRALLAGGTAAPNTAFRAVFGGTLAVLAVVVWTPAAGLFGFQPPPPEAWLAALLAPFVLAIVLAAHARRRELDGDQHRARAGAA